MEEPEIVYREMRPEDAPAALALRNAVFSGALLTLADWERDEMVVSTAWLGGHCVGAIPLAMRELRLGPDCAIRAPFENAVGTREDLRSRGIGTGMIVSARQFMRDRADGLFVYRGAERSAGYRFYVKSGHFDLLYTHVYHLATPRASGVSATIVPISAESVDAYDERLLPLFAGSYGAYAGYPRRHRGYWRKALSSSIFAAIPMELLLILVGDVEAPRAYAIAGIATRRSQPTLDLLEMATSGGDLAHATEVLRAAADLAAARSSRVAIKLAPDDPFIPAVLAQGFVALPRGTVVLGQLLDVPDFFARYGAGRFHMDGVGLRVWTPVQDHVLLPAVADAPTLTLEMKEETLHRWLLGRTDLAARLRDGTVTAHGAGPGAIRAACAAIPYQPWAYQQLDWI